MRYLSILILITSLLVGQLDHNHPELDWQTIETEHFQIHYYPATEGTAREGATVAERIYPHVTAVYDYQPPEKTDLVFIDTDDFSNGMAFYYDNKIYIWATPLNFMLRGSHRWLQNVITHEFSHIVSLQAAMKAGTKIPAAYLQLIGYEQEKRKDVLYGYPNVVVSYPIPGTVVPPWLAEGIAQFMYADADWDLWDTHRDMLMRDQVLNNKMLTLAQMNSFGKKGVGNESVYNSGYALVKYIVSKYGVDKLVRLMRELAVPWQYSINSAISKSLDVPAGKLYQDFSQTLEKRYEHLTASIRGAPKTGEILQSQGSVNIHPVWSPAGDRLAFLSNRGNDYYSQTDLYLHDFEQGATKKLISGVRHGVTWHPEGEKIYYVHAAKIPNRNGSRYFDLYEYDLEAEDSRRLTVDARSYSPVYIHSDSSIAYLASHDGTQNIFRLDLKDNSRERLTNFTDRRSVYTLEYDPANERLLFDYSVSHFRNIGYLSLIDSTRGDLMASPLWDERNMALTPQGDFIYADDRSGIYNLFYLNSADGTQGYLTNVPGGAFMPDVSADGKIAYSLYEDQSYRIAILPEVEWIDQEQVGYSPDFYLRNRNLTEPIVEMDTTPGQPYIDNFTNMFILPKLTWEYGLFKPGVYFYSTEVLERLSVFGQAATNRIADLDLFLLFEMSRLRPTLYTEITYLKRNRPDQRQYSVYPVDENLTFRLVQFKGGLRSIIKGISHLDMFISWQRYRAFIKQQLPTSPLEQGIAYDYYRGAHLGLNWSIKLVKARADANINPSKGFKYDLSLTYEQNNFINGLNLSESGTLVEDFHDNNLVRAYVETNNYLQIPATRRWTVELETNLGWHSNAAADSFFNFFGGGMPGIQGYPFYSIEGNRVAIGKFTLRVPLLYLRNIPLGWFSLNNCTAGAIVQAGDAWSGAFDQYSIKKSVGAQLRFNGFSFYNYPTAIGLEVHYGLDKLERVIEDKTYVYGKEPRYYVSLLFGF